MTAPFWLDPDNTEHPFPDPALALREPDGLLAVGGDLSPVRLLTAYCNGIFPWYSDEQPILWWSPDPRSVLFPDQLKVSRSLRKSIRRQSYHITLDTVFAEVIRACSQTPRPGQPGTWITAEMQAAYIELHKLGFAHSAEAWQDGKLVGGLYGVAVGKVFFGESMFAHATDASKIAFVYLLRQLQRWQFALIDCQVQTAHLDSLGAENVPRQKFIQLLHRYCTLEHIPGPWKLDEQLSLHPELLTPKPDE